jgi:hypothetical protein
MPGQSGQGQGGLTPEQITAITTAVIAGMTADQANQAQVVSDAMLEALSTCRRDLLNNNNNNNGGQGGLRPQDIGYFHPEAEDDKGYGVISDAKPTKYTDVHAFCQQLIHLEATIDIVGY